MFDSRKESDSIEKLHQIAKILLILIYLLHYLCDIVLRKLISIEIVLCFHLFTALWQEIYQIVEFKY